MNTDETQMKPVAVIAFTDLDTSDEALAIVRSSESSVVVGLSLKHNGDMQVVMKKQEARLLADALQKAVS